LGRTFRGYQGFEGPKDISGVRGGGLLRKDPTPYKNLKEEGKIILQKKAKPHKRRRRWGFMGID